MIALLRFGHKEETTPTNTSVDAAEEDVPSADPGDNDGTVSEVDDAPQVKPSDTADTNGLTRRRSTKRAVIFMVLPAVALLLALGSAWLKWWQSENRADQAAGVESIQVATESAIAMLSYQPDTIDNDLGSARDRLTGAFRDSYTELINDVVIPGAKQKRISAIATVPGAALVSASESQAVVLVMVNQTTVIGTDPPTQTSSSIRVTLDKVDDRWLISDFTPIE